MEPTGGKSLRHHGLDGVTGSWMTRPGSSAPTSPDIWRSGARIRRTTFADPELLCALREAPDRRAPRRPDARPLSFGGGSRDRVGALPAKAQDQLVFTELPRRRGIRPSGEDVVRRPQADIHGLGELRIDPLS